MEKNLNELLGTLVWTYVGIENMAQNHIACALTGLNGIEHDGMQEALAGMMRRCLCHADTDFLTGFFANYPSLIDVLNVE